MMDPSPPVPLHENVTGKLRLGFGRGEPGGTRLTERYRTGLFHLGKPYWDGEQLVVQLINPTAGIFENDSLESHVQVAEGARACLLSPSSTQVYAMPSGECAHSRQSFSVESGGALAVLPKWIVLHGGSRLHQETTINIGNKSSLLFVDLTCAGRTGFGEKLEYEEFLSTIEIRKEDRLILRERLASGRSQNRWIWKSHGQYFTHLASVYLAFENAEPVCREILDGFSDLYPKLSFGMSALAEDFIVLRMFAQGGIEIETALMDVYRRLGSHTAVSSVQKRLI